MIQISSTLFKELWRELRVLRLTVLRPVIWLMACQSDLVQGQTNEAAQLSAVSPRSPFAVSASMCGKTNNCATPCLQFCLPPMHLRHDPQTEASGLKSAPAGTLISSSPLPAAANEIVSQDWHFQSSVFRSDRFYLIQSKVKAPPDSAFVRFVDMVFTPEVVEVGKVSVSSPILTVAKRKNPLCLLSAFATDQGLLTFNLLELSW